MDIREQLQKRRMDDIRRQRYLQKYIRPQFREPTIYETYGIAHRKKRDATLQAAAKSAQAHLNRENRQNKGTGKVGNPHHDARGRFTH